MITKQCTVCGSGFSTATVISKFCSHECFLKSRRLKENTGFNPERSCRGCGNKFTAENHNQAFCGIRCRANFHNAKIREAKPPVGRICAKCGASFTGNGPAKYCSRECRYKAKIECNKTYYNKPDSLKKKKCEDCGVEFESVKSNQKRCGVCAQQRNMKHQLYDERRNRFLRAIYLGDEV